jgi:hypothetical protein
VYILKKGVIDIMIFKLKMKMVRWRSYLPQLCYRYGLTRLKRYQRKSVNLPEFSGHVVM